MMAAKSALQTSILGLLVMVFAASLSNDAARAQDYKPGDKVVVIAEEKLRLPDGDEVDRSGRD